MSSHAPDAAEAAPPVTITLKPAGPILIDGPVVIRNNAGDVVIPPPSKVPGQVKLCGCGFSKNRPFCDGSHKR
jgi:CDGSH-type Zn-finger protein